MFKDIAPKANPGAAFVARKLRKKRTLPEVLLWRQLRLRPYSLKFRCQHGTGDYVLDFYCSDARLAVEVDGLAPSNAERAEHDGRRAAWLSSYGIETLRIPASEVLAMSPKRLKRSSNRPAPDYPTTTRLRRAVPLHETSSGRID